MRREDQSSGRILKAAHRPDIDGLRAVAVLPVMAYHAGIGLVPGGFIGVDVFFVISGYLITQVLLQDIARDRFSVLNFYERRVRRIAPALLGALIGTSIVCAWYGIPAEVLDYGRSLIAATLSASNFYFWRTSGYFSAPALTQPLLHTWSLAVEEQFYIFWPLCLFAGWRFFGNRLALATLIATAASFALSAVGAFVAPSGTFYLLPTRAWELFLGALLALGMFPRPLKAVARNILALLGVVLIAGSALRIHSDMPFPGALAAPACVGAFLVILAGRDGTSLTGRLLSWRPIAFVGLISYSLYLWHWPLIVFQRDYGLLLIPGAPDREQKLLVIGCSFVLGTISWRFIEQPFRVGVLRPSRQALFKITAAAAAITIAFGASAWAAGGFPSRYSPQQLRIAAFLIHDGSAHIDPCFLHESTGPNSFPASCLEMNAQKRNFLLLGDSHAWELAYGLRAEYPDINFLQATASDCFPALRHDWKEAQFCVHAMDAVLRDFLANHRVDGVIIAARWDSGCLPRIAQTLAWLHQRAIPVTLVGPTLVYDLPLPRLMLTSERTGQPALIEQHLTRGLWALDTEMLAIARENGTQYVSMLRMFCPRQCNLTDESGLPLIFDQEHVTNIGSIRVARTLKRQGYFAL
ncbi:MAG TPA: acyltransferase family protein [Steroidobacteraceae bacterium]|nr:acyltransferase family protein [Steroidobacteraceae bacterium]